MDLTQYRKNEVLVVRIDSGEELLATTKFNVKTNTATLSDVTLIVPSEKGIGLMHFAPYTVLVEGYPLELDVSRIVFVVRPVEKLKEQYNQMFSKINVPNEGLVLPK